MRKQDLKTGMRVKTREGGVYLVLKDIESKNYGHQEIGFVRENGFLIGTRYRDDLIYLEGLFGSPDYDIMEVFTINDNPKALLHNGVLNLSKLHSIWKREELTDRQVELLGALKLLGYGYLAKDSDGEVYAYEESPFKGEDMWDTRYNVFPNHNFITIHNEELISLVSWEDKEPFKIK